MSFNPKQFSPLLLAHQLLLPPLFVVPKVFDQRVHDDLEEGKEEAEDHPEVDHLHVRGLWQGGRGRDE